MDQLVLIKDEENDYWCTICRERPDGSWVWRKSFYGVSAVVHISVGIDTIEYTTFDCYAIKISWETGEEISRLFTK